MRTKHRSGDVPPAQYAAVLAAGENIRHPTGGARMLLFSTAEQGVFRPSDAGFVMDFAGDFPYDLTRGWARAGLTAAGMNWVVAAGFVGGAWYPAKPGAPPAYIGTLERRIPDNLTRR